VKRKMTGKERPIKWAEKNKTSIKTTGAARMFFTLFEAYRKEGLTDSEVWLIMLDSKKSEEDLKVNRYIRNWLQENEIGFVGFNEDENVDSEFVFRKLNKPM
jgi:hypothetical protein